MQIVNLHCHLAQIKDLDGFLKTSQHIYISNALDKEELQQHLEIKQNNFHITTGQHPLYPKESITEVDLIKLLDENKLYAVTVFHWMRNTAYLYVHIIDRSGN